MSRWYEQDAWFPGGNRVKPILDMADLSRVDCPCSDWFTIGILGMRMLRHGALMVTKPILTWGV